MTRGLVIRTRELGGKIVTLGDGMGRGIVVEKPDFNANDYGPSAAAFVLARDPDVQWPDLRAYAPLLAERDGVPFFRGRIAQTPMTRGGLARQIGVQAEGQQFRLDDDVYERRYVDSDLAGWKDWRSSLQSPLGGGALCAAGQVTSEGGGITLMLPKGSVVQVNDTVGVIYDAGPNFALARWTMTYTGSNNNAFSTFGLDAITDETGATATVLLSQTLNAWGALGGTTVTVPAGNRYLIMFISIVAGTTSPLTADLWIRVLSSIEYADATYESGNTSVLLGSTVIRDALDRATMQLSSDRSLITTTSFFLPEFALSAPATPREVIDGVNAFHGMQFRVRADNRAEFRLRPSTPTIEVGADSTFNEASAGDASEVYTSVIVSYTDAAGVPQRVVRVQPSSLKSTSALQPTNPSATPVGTAGWFAPFGGVLSRDTGVFDSSPASFKATMFAYGAGGRTILTHPAASWAAGTWIAGRQYDLAFAARIDNPLNTVGDVFDAFVQDANEAFVGRVAAATIVANTWTVYTMPFVLQTPNAPNLQFVGYGTAVASALWIDSLLLTESSPTIVDRWGFKRTKVLETGMTLTLAGAQQIGDTFLLGHRTTPLKGSLIVTGDGRARSSPSGAPMTCADLVGAVGDLIRIRNLIDPDTGKLGRVGRIASVAYDAAANVATLEIDSTNRNFEALLARLALVTGQVRS